MKKSICFFMALLMCLSMLLCACGSSAENKEEAPEVTLPEGIMQTSDPAEDDVFNVLMIGNSYCYSYPDELFNMAKAVGIEMRICNVYYSGCSIAQHWNWWKIGKGSYEFCTYDSTGRTAEGEPVEGEGMTLEYCLSQYNWDVISLQEAVGVVRRDPEGAIAGMSQTLPELLEYITGQYPLSKLVWQQTWAYQVGFSRSGYEVTNTDVQTQLHQNIRQMAMAVCEKHNLQRIPSGDAWAIARSNPLIGDTLCERLSGTDFHHEGDVGGGQYLNACVWFEVLTGQSCVGNSFRPTDYALSVEKVEALQAAAHQAVEDMKAGK